MNLNITSFFWKLAFLNCLLFSFAHDIEAQSAEVFQHFPDSHPLSNTSVHQMTQDRQGFLWLATKRGLIRFDGLRTKIYQHHPFDPNTVSSNDIWAVCQDNENELLWIATSTGLSRFHQKSQTFKHYRYHPDSLKNRSTPSAKVLTFVMQANDGKLWLATGGGGLNAFEPETEKFSYYYPDGNQDFSNDFNHLGFVAEDQKGDIWFGTQAGLIRLNPQSGQMTRFKEEIDALKTNFALTGDPMGRIWAFTKKGLFVFEEDRFRQLPLDLSIWPKRFGFSWEEFYPEEAILDSKNRLWFGGWDKGLFSYHINSGELRHFAYDPMDKNSIGHNSIYAIFEDRNHQLWVGNKGLDRLNLDFQKLSFAPLEKHPVNTGFVPVTNILEADQRLWLNSVGNGLTLFQTEDHTQQSFFIMAPGALHNYTRNTLQLADGSFWVETWMKGVWTFDPDSGQFGPFPHIQGLPSPPDRFWRLNDTLIALRAKDKLFFYNPQTKHLQMLPDDFSSIYSGPPFLPTLMMDSKGFIWIGLEQDGLIRFDPASNTYQQFLHEPGDPSSLTSNKAYCIFEDSKGRVWVGTNGSGLNQLVWKKQEGSEASFRHWLESESDLLSDNILSIQEDNKGLLWICTDRGISSFDPATEIFRNYKHEECGQSFYWPHVDHKSSDGTLYFGGMEGLTIVRPEAPPIDQSPLAISITELSVNNELQNANGPILSESVEFTKKIVLRHNQNNFALSFSALNYARPEKTRFQYRLKGLQDQWIEADAAIAQANYTNIPHGSYTFQLRAANTDQIWNEEGVSLKIVVRPPWWQTNWAYVLWTVLGLGMLFLVYRIQINRELAKAEISRLKELDEMKSRVSTNITHEFRTPLTLILGISDQLKGQVHEVGKSQLNIIRRNARQLLVLVNELMDLARLEVGRLQLEEKQADIVPFLSYLSESYREWANREGIEFEFLKNVKYCVMDYDSLRIEQILSNLVSNAIKFTPSGGKISLIIKKAAAATNGSSFLEITIRDSGVGIAPEQLPHIFNRFHQAGSSSEGSGIGLAFCKELINVMKGKIEVESTIGKGSTFSVFLPVKNNKAISNNGFHIPQRSRFLGESPEKPANSFKKGTAPLILIAEDNSDLLRMLSDALRSSYRVLEAKNGQEGIDKAKNHIPDLIITDVMMPYKNGFELCHQLKSDPLTCHIPIIMLSAKTEAEDRITGLRKGADAYLNKPFIAEELEVRIQFLLEQRKKLQVYYLSKFGMDQQLTKAPSAYPENTIDQDFLYQLQNFIIENIDNEAFGVEVLSQELYLSPSSLNRKIKSLLNKTPLEYIRYLRLAKAKELLSQTDFPINMIAGKTGFSDQRYFARIFKKETGQTPSAYRVHSRENNQNTLK